MPVRNWVECLPRRDSILGTLLSRPANEHEMAKYDRLVRAGRKQLLTGASASIMWPIEEE